MFPDWLSTVHHDGSPRYVSDPSPRVGDTIHVRLRVGAGAPVRRVFLRTSADGEQVLTACAPGPVRPPSQWFEADLPVRDASTHYRFVLEADDGIWWYTAAGPAFCSPLDAADFRIVAGVAPPEWLRSTVFYQIFVDRFANGDPSRDPRPEEYDAPGYPYKQHEYEGRRPQTCAWEAPPPEGQSFPLVFYGGDLPGITQRLDHLQDLGVGALYLSPVFTSPSNHRYDVADYEHVDPRLGGDEALARLREALTQRGMRYLLDVEVRHLSFWNPWFQLARADARRREAQLFTFDRHPDGYATWLGVFSLPKLNYRAAELRERMMTGHDAVLRRWLRPPYAADGWGVNLPQVPTRPGEGELTAEVGRTMRRCVKETRADACLFTRNFCDIGSQLQGDQVDGTSDFASFTFPLWHWLRGYRADVHGERDALSGPSWPTAALEEAWRGGRAASPWAVTLHQYTQIGSQDVPRIRTLLGGNRALQRLATVVQFTYPGVPGVYYGDEIGMEDVPHLAQRGCMVWDERRWDRETLAFYRDLIALRRSSVVLQEGGFQMLAVEPDAFAFQREGVAGRVLVIAQRSDRPRPPRPVPVAHGGVADGTRFVEHFSGEVAIVRQGALPVPELPQGATIWIAEETPDSARRPRGGRRILENLLGDGRQRSRPRRPRCPVCGRKDGSRLEGRLTMRDPSQDERWVCLWCGATWNRARSS